MAIPPDKKCLAQDSSSGAICQKTRGHAEGKAPRGRHHYDPDGEQYWTDDPTDSED